MTKRQTMGLIITRDETRALVKVVDPHAVRQTSVRLNAEEALATAVAILSTAMALKDGGAITTLLPSPQVEVQAHEGNVMVSLLPADEKWGVEVTLLPEIAQRTATHLRVIGRALRAEEAKNG